MVELWRVELGKVSEKAGQSLADPKDSPNLFPDFQAALEAETMLRKERSRTIPAKDFSEILVSYILKKSINCCLLKAFDMSGTEICPNEHRTKFICH